MDLVLQIVNLFSGNSVSWRRLGISLVRWPHIVVTNDKGTRVSGFVSGFAVYMTALGPHLELWRCGGRSFPAEECWRPGRKEWNE